MGCFTVRCSISHLPIGGGDKIVWVPLMRLNSYEGFEDYTAWFPGIRSSYNEYGSPIIDDMSETLKNIFVDVLQKNIYEIGTGNNTCHDVPVFKGMSFDKYQNAMLEKRLHIQKKSEKSYFLTRPDNVPTLQNVSSIVGDKYYVDVLSNGVVRVRYSEYTTDETFIDNAANVLNETFNCIKLNGTGGYWACELWVFTKYVPNDYNQQIFDIKEKQNTTIIVQGMIREDVWDIIMKSSFGEKYCETKITLETIKKRIEKIWNTLRMESVQYDNDEYNLFPKSKLNKRDLISVVASVDSSESYCGFETISDALIHAVEKCCEDDKEELINAFSETIFAGQALSFLRKTWEPTRYIGCQFEEWSIAADFATKIASIANENLLKSNSESDLEE